MCNRAVKKRATFLLIGERMSQAQIKLIGLFSPVVSMSLSWATIRWPRYRYSVLWMMVASAKMTLVYTVFLVFGTTHLVSGADNRDRNNPYCFQFTYLGPIPPKDTNCTHHETTPCVAPFIYTPDGTPPNVTYMWNNMNQTAITCPMDSARTCMKYTWVYNNAAINVTYFCGKMIEDKTTAILSGCYSQDVNGYTVEVCACQSDAGRMPCNSSNRAWNPIQILTILTVIATFELFNL